MLVARDEAGQFFSLADPYKKDWLLRQRLTHSYVCPVCEEPVIMKLGEKKCYHFSHRQDSACHIQSEPETPNHIQGKTNWYHWLRKQRKDPHLEKYFPDIHQRADLWLNHFPKPLALEYQCSNIPIAQLIQRDKGYREKLILPLWIFSESRLQRIKTNLYSWSSLEWSTRRFPFSQSPLTPLQRKKGFLTFYNPTTNHVHFLYHLIPLNSRRIWAEKLSLPLTSLTLQDLLTPHLKPNPLLTLTDVWLHQKKRWRTSCISKHQIFERHLQKIAESKHLVWKAFPGLVGLPIGDDGVIETPNYIWQGWLCLTYLVDHPVGRRISRLEIERAFLNLVSKKWVSVRKLCGETCDPGDLIFAYLKGLSFMGYLQETKDQVDFVILKPLRWLEPFYEDLIKEDRHILSVWLEQSKS